MTRSETIADLAAALAKAQGTIDGASKSSANPFFKSRYADLAAVWEACRAPLAQHGLSVVQCPSADGVRVTVETLLLHASGQWLKGEISVSAKEDSPQAVGSCITYLRRYALQSIVGVAPEDDDAEAAEGRPTAKAKPQLVPLPAGYADWLDELTATAANGSTALQAFWKTSALEYRRHLTTAAPQTWETLKTRASQAREAVTA